MDQPLPDDPPRPGRPPEERLESWKEIAAYLRRDVTTAQRWERREGMPVHRHLHDKGSSVYAFRSDLDEWTRTRHRRFAGADLPGDIDTDTDPSGAPEPGAAGLGAAPASSGRRLSSRSAIGWALSALAVLVAATVWVLQRADYFWTNPLKDVAVQLVADFDGTEQAAALSRDGRLMAFVSDRDGTADVWVTQLGTGEFRNLTQGGIRELINPSVRALGFSPDGALVTFWTRRTDSGEIAIWAVPALGGQPRPYLDGVAEFDWSSDGSRLVYHTPGPGDPMFVRESGGLPRGRPLFEAPPGLHAHFPLWSPDDTFIYFVQGSVPDAMDVWRIRPGGGAPERITSHNSRVSHPVWLNRRTLLYLATDSNGSGPWLHTLDVERRVVHRLSSGIDKYTSLATSADLRRIVATWSRPKETLWRLPITSAPVDGPGAVRVNLTTARGSSPRLGPGYMVYVSSRGAGDALWKIADGQSSEVWSSPGARVIGSPAVGPDGRIAFSVERGGLAQLHVVNADGTSARVVTEALALCGSPAWAPDGRSIASAAYVDGVPRLFTISLDGRSVVRLSPEYSADPVWSPDGRFIAYSGPDVGTTFQVKAVSADGRPFPLRSIVLTRGARPLRFLPGARALLVLRGEIHHKDLWLIDLETGAERQLTRLPSDFHVRDFDVSPDGREVVLDRFEEQSDVVLLDRSRR